MKKLFLNGSSKRRTVSPAGLWTRRVLSISVAVVALIALVLSGCPDDSPAATDSTAPTFSTAPAASGITATTANVKLTANEDGKVFWVLYADGTAAPTAAALIIAASGTDAGVQRSGASVAVKAATELTVALTTLAASTTYDFYAVLQDSAGNIGKISTIEITTLADATDNTAPTFSTAPAVDGDETATTATVKLTASEAGKVFWVLYADSTADAPSPDDLITAASGSTIGVKQSGDSVAVTTAEETVNITGLTPGTTYNFYAVLQDSAGNKGTVSAKVVVTTAAAADKTPPAFASGKAPAVDGDETATTATVKFTATEAGKVFWVLYASSDASPDNAADLIADASGSTVGVKQSGDSVAVTTAEETVNITGLTAATTYNFYAVLQDAAGNNGAVSTKLVVTTASTASYICTNGTAKTGTPAGTTDVVACETCAAGFTPTGTLGEENTDCTDQTAPTFSAAPALDGTPAATTANVKLTASEAGKVFWILYADGTAAPTDVAAFITAAKGSAGVARSGDAVAVDAATELTVELTGLAESTTYDFYAVLQDDASNNGALSAVVEITTADVTAPTFSAQPAVKAGTLAAKTVTVTLTSSEAGKLFWVVYANDTPVASNTALLAAATADPQPGTVVARGDVLGVDVTAATAVEVAVTGLTGETDYDFYAVVQDSAGNNSALSNKLEITTPDQTPPEFVSGKEPAVDGSPTATAATVKFTASEAGKVFWILHEDGTDAPTDVVAFIAAAADGSTGVQQSGDSVAVTDAEFTVELTGLDASTDATTYDFYAVLQDSAGNNAAAIAVVEITTAADSTAPTFTTAPATGILAANAVTVTLTASEAGKVFWILHADGTAVPTDVAAFITAAADGSTGEQQSGDSVTVDAATEFTVAFAALSTSTTYDFYAVLQDDAGNNGAAIAVVEITTTAADNTAPTFSAQPEVKAGTLTAETVTVTLTSDEGGKLFWAVYTDGTAVADAAAFADATADPQPATVVARSAAAGVDVTAATAVEVAVTGLTAETGYDFYAVVVDAAANVSALSNKLDITTAAADNTAPMFSAAPAVDGSPTATAAMVKFTASEAGKVFWVLYDSGSAPTDVADLIADASEDGTDGLQRSGTFVTVDDTETTVEITGLPASTTATTYDFYAVLQDSVGNNGVISAVVEITTAADNTAPTFSAALALKSGSLTGTGAEITFTASEAGKVFWILHADGTAAPTDVAAFIAAAADGSTGEQQSGDSVTVDDTETTVTITGLTANTIYDFYAVLQDGAGNNVATFPAVVEINTDVTAPTFATAPAPGISAINGVTVTLTAGEAGKLFWVLYADGANAPADAAALIAAASGSTVGVARSGDSVDATTDAATVTITDLALNTNYDFYAVLQDGAGNGALSAKLDVATLAALPDTLVVYGDTVGAGGRVLSTIGQASHNNNLVRTDLTGTADNTTCNGTATCISSVYATGDWGGFFFENFAAAGIDATVYDEVRVTYKLSGGDGFRVSIDSYKSDGTGNIQRVIDPRTATGDATADGNWYTYTAAISAFAANNEFDISKLKAVGIWSQGANNTITVDEIYLVNTD